MLESILKIHFAVPSQANQLHLRVNVSKAQAPAMQKSFVRSIQNFIQQIDVITPRVVTDTDPLSSVMKNKQVLRCADHALQSSSWFEIGANKGSLAGGMSFTV